MTGLVSIALTNAAIATLLAAVVWIVTRCYRHPALAHLLWTVVLVKLFTPLLVAVPIRCNIDLFADSADPRFIAASDGAEGGAKTASNDAVVLPQSDTFGQRSRQVSNSLNSLPSARAPELNTSAPVEISDVRSAKNQKAVRRTATSFSWQRAVALAGNWLPVVWLCGSGLLAAWVVSRAWRFRRCIRLAAVFDPVLQRRVERLGKDAGLKEVPHVVVVRGAVSPMLWGLGRQTRLIFPEQLLRQLAPAACDTLLLHELAHYRRGDQWLRLVELAAHVCYWWHPVVWWSRREIEAAEEQCCDAWVVEHQSGARRTYAEALLAAIDFLCEPPTFLPPVASGLGEVSLLRVRLTQIMQGDVAANLSRRIQWTALVLAVAVLPVGPALLGASVPPLRLARPTTTTASPQFQETPAATTEPSTAGGPIVTETQPDPASATLVSLPATRQPRAAVTAVAVSHNGKYRLERRRAAQVSLVNQLTDWRLDMSSHGIRCVAFTADSNQFFTGHEDGVVRVWDSETGGLVMSLKGSTGPILSIAVGPGDSATRRVAAGSRDGNVIVWDSASGEEVARAAPVNSSVSCVRWSPQGDRLAVALGDFSKREPSELVIWSPFTNQAPEETPLEEPVAALAWSAGDNRLFLTDWNGVARRYQVASGLFSEAVSLGPTGKQIAEAAHWSADCPLAPASGTLGAE
jgi:bla regulator protein BlaR1